MTTANIRTISRDALREYSLVLMDGDGKQVEIWGGFEAQRESWEGEDGAHEAVIIHGHAPSISMIRDAIERDYNANI